MLQFVFWGSGSTNYGNKLLELACGFYYDYPEPLAQTILKSWLLNPSGYAGRWQEGDVLQEHNNKAIKRVFNKKASGFGGDFIRTKVSLNVLSFGQLQQSVLGLLGLSQKPQGRSKVDHKADIDCITTSYEHHRLFTFQPGRTQAFVAQDVFSAGYSKLQDSALQKFLDCTVLDPESMEAYVENEEDNVSDPPAPLAMEGGNLVEGDVLDVSEMF